MKLRIRKTKDGIWAYILNAAAKLTRADKLWYNWMGDNEEVILVPERPKIVRDVGVNKIGQMHENCFYRIILYMFAGDIILVNDTINEGKAIELAEGLSKQLGVPYIKEYENET